MKESLTFDDVILIPSNFSRIKSRKDVIVSVDIEGYTFSHPIIPANMKTVTGKEMAYAAAVNGGLAILHRFQSLTEQAADYTDINMPNNVALSIGVNVCKDNAEQAFKLLYDATKCKIWCVDIANANSEAAINMVKFLKKQEKVLNDKFLIIAGNIVTGEAAGRLWDAGANIVKVGIGQGSACTSSVIAGHGRGQISAILDVAEYRFNSGKYLYKYIISDGGIQNPGDCVKALAAGADMVMIGNLFAGSVESPGETNVINGIMHKKYEGSSTYKNRVEGVSGWVPINGTYQGILEYLLDGIRSGCSYSGAYHISELQDMAEFEKVTNNTLTLSHPHDIKVI